MAKNVGAIKNSVARRIKYLVLLQAGEKFRSVKTANKKKLAFNLFLSVLVIAGVTFGLNYLFGYLKGSYSFKIGTDLFTSVLFVTQIISIVTCVGSMMAVLYNGKENLILMAFPCKYNEIFVSKIIVFTLGELKKSCFFILPFLFSYGLASGGGVAYWLQLIPIWLFLTLFPVFISAILSIPFIFVKKFLENHSVLYAAVIAATLIGVFILIVFLLDKLPRPIRLIAIYNQFMTSFEASLVQFNRFALFYNFIGRAAFGQKVYLYLPIALIIFAAVAALTFLVAMPFYFKAASGASENSVTKKHRVREHKHNNLFLTFVRKEFKLMFRTSSSIISAVTIVFVFPILSYVLNFVVAGIRTSDYGTYLTVAFNLMITLSLLSTYNANCAQALSSEGSEFSVLKAAPSNTMIVTWAKVLVTMVVDLLAVATMCIVLTVTTKLSAVDIVLMVFTIIPVSLGNILWSFQLDITNPKVNDYAVKGDAVVDNPNVARALVIGFVISTLFGVIGLLLLFDSHLTGWIRLILIAYAFFGARLYLYISNLKAYFNEIQG
ncbi:MAG: hypothetical protein IJ735_06780 [Clostridia bacterium]|nr:hypothetical protein [Clostridia bacterium]